jgi:hypothetical protein
MLQIEPSREPAAIQTGCRFRPPKASGHKEYSERTQKSPRQHALPHVLYSRNGDRPVAIWAS